MTFYSKYCGLKNLSKNEVYSPGKFPRDIYLKETVSVPDYKPNYISPGSDHPATFSRFGYKHSLQPGCENGYCTANMPGKYNSTPDTFHESADPQDMAPYRFYQLPFSNTLQVLPKHYKY